jgi:hypothetical protein
MSIHKLLLSLVALYLHTAGNAQDRPLYYGLVAGLNASEITGSDYVGYRKASPMGGFSIGKELENGRWLWQSNLLYSQKGELRQPRNGDQILYRLRLHYLEANALFHFQQKRFNYTVGPGLGVLLAWKEENQVGPVGDPRRFLPVEPSITIGVQVPLDYDFSAEIRFTNSIYPVRKHLSGQSFRLNFGQFNTVVSFIITWQRPVHKPVEEELEKK